MRLPFVALALLLALSPAVTRAQGASTQAAAEELFERGRKLMEQGNYAEACPKLAASAKLDPGAGTLLNLAACYEKNGQTASAWVTYRDAEATASAKGRADWANKARTKARALEPKLARLTIVVAAPARGLVIERDGVPVSEGELGTALPIDPGSHAIQATAPGHQPWSTTIEVTPERSSTVNVPELAPTPPPPASTPPATASPPTPPPQAGPAPGAGQRIAGVAVAGAGLVGVALGAVFGLDAKSTHDEALDEHCRTETICTAEGATLVDDAQTSATVSTIAFGLGAAALAAGAVLYFTAPSGADKAAVSVGLRVDASRAALELGGAF
jgi:hypothetical protein